MFKQLTQLVVILNKAGQFLQYAQAFHAALTQLVAHLSGTAPNITTAPAPAVASPAPVVTTPNSPPIGNSAAAPYVWPTAPAPLADDGKLNGLDVSQ